MLHLYSIPVTPDDARHLVATLISGRFTAGAHRREMILKGVDRELYAVAVTPEERDAILSVLEDPPEGLAELRGKLARDHSDRAD
jgi:hypothetical protein